MRFFLAVAILTSMAVGQEVMVVNLPKPDRSHLAASDDKELDSCASVFFRQMCGSAAQTVRGKTSLKIEKPERPGEGITLRLTNTGDAPIQVPVALGRAPVRRHGRSEFRDVTLSLYTVQKGETTSMGSVHFFGTDEIPGSLLPVHPGQWISFRFQAACSSIDCTKVSAKKAKLFGEWSEYLHSEKRDLCLRDRSSLSVRSLKSNRMTLDFRKGLALEGPQ